MKHTLLTALIATLTGVGGYFIGKNDIFSRLKLDPVTSTNTEATGNTSNSKRPVFSAKAVVQISPPVQTSHNSSQIMMTRQFFQTEFNIIKDQRTINKAIKDYALDDLFKVDAQPLAEQILQSLKTYQERGTDLINIEAFRESEVQAQQILYAVVYSYESVRREASEKRRNEVIEKFKQKIQAQEKKVEEKRNALFKLSKQLGIPYLGINNGSSLQSQANPNHTDKVISAEEHTEFGKIKDDYEREFIILQKIKSAEFQETIEERLERSPIVLHEYGWTPAIVLHEYGWTPEVQTFMSARKQK